MMKRSIVPVILTLAAFGVGIAIGVSRQTPVAIELAAGTLLTPPRDLAPFSLRSLADSNVDNSDLRDRWTLLFFGFTRCPDICPTTLQLLADARDTLDVPDAQLPRIMLASVDPARDDAQTLATYVNYFGEQMIGVTGDDDAIARFATDLGIVYQRIDLGADGDYTMDHSGAVLLIDPNAQLRAVFSPPLSRRAIAADLAQLIR
ncbi:MAG: SCO family protein [Pseudomonadota bacterium]